MTICKHCVMDDTADPDIWFDQEGICNYCWEYDQRADEGLFEDYYPEAFNAVIGKIKADAKGKPFDCVIGLSGGLDSSYTAHILAQAGIKPLVVLVDNGWDTEIAKDNVTRILDGLNLPWIKYELDLPQFHDLQLAFLKAGVANAEAPTDHAIVSLLYQTAIKYDLKWIVHGGNIVSEAIMPEAWGYDAKDWKHIEAIHTLFGKRSLKGFPHMTVWNWFKYTFVKKIKWLPILNYIPYRKNTAERELRSYYCWHDYGHKHCESIYTRWVQGYLLPGKFGVDKRKAHLSTLINSGQMSRKEALDKLSHSPFDSMEDAELIGKTLVGDFEHWGEWTNILSAPLVPHSVYPSNEKWFKRFSGIVKMARRKATYRERPKPLLSRA